jgi:3'-5' exoribonuclease
MPGKNPRAIAIVPLSEMTTSQEADLFALLSAKEELTTREGKPYFKVTFRDHAREVSFPVWQDSPFGSDCRETWQPGTFYKLRAVYRETSYGAQLDIRRIRAVVDADAGEGFSPSMCLPQSRYPAEAMFDELFSLARELIQEKSLRELVCDILSTHRLALLTLPAATHNHHAYVSGYLEHVLSVTRTCVYLADKYIEQYADMRPPLDKDLVIAGGILHDIGKLREIEEHPTGAQYTAAGNLIGHLLQGRDIVREATAGLNLPGDMLLRLEHIIVAHQRLPEWGSPKPPMTPEALLVHYADDIDAKMNMMAAVLRDDKGTGPMTSKKNVLFQAVYKGTST